MSAPSIVRLLLNSVVVANNHEHEQHNISYLMHVQRLDQSVIADGTDKVYIAPGVTVASLRRFRAALIGPTQGFPKRRRLCLKKTLKP